MYYLERWLTLVIILKWNLPNTKYNSFSFESVVREDVGNIMLRHSEVVYHCGYLYVAQKGIVIWVSHAAWRDFIGYIHVPGHREETIL
jgi:hypothetical protein